MEAEASEVASRLRSLYGTTELLRAGVVHVTAVARSAQGPLRVLKIDACSPKSESDLFVLNLCRARADAILTSAGNLRDEPSLVSSLMGPSADSLAHYRSETLGKGSPPVCALMTRGGDLPLAHPLWSDGTPKLVLTTPEAQQAVAARLGSRAEVVGVEALDARVAVAFLHARGLPLVSIEAGPSVNAALYRPPSQVDELLLSICEVALPDDALGGALVEDAALFAGLSCVAESPRDEQSGRWRFQRWVARVSAG